MINNYKFSPDCKKCPDKAHNILSNKNANNNLNKIRNQEDYIVPNNNDIPKNLIKNRDRRAKSND